jgi:hypothetical protein
MKQSALTNQTKPSHLYDVSLPPLSKLDTMPIFANMGCALFILPQHPQATTLLPSRYNNTPHALHPHVMPYHTSYTFPSPSWV